MIEFMDGIVEAVEQFIEGVGENALIILGIFAKIMIFITAPVWILPYKLIRDIMQDRNGGKCESQDCDSCPFPPLSAPMIKCKKTPKKKCRFMAERRKKR